jgi:hypothetical protein
MGGVAVANERGVQISVTISATAHAELAALAEWKGIALASHIRQIIESHHENPGTQKLIDKAKSELSQKQRK